MLTANVSKAYDGFVASQLPPSASVKPQSYLPPYIGVSTRLGQYSNGILTLNSNDDVIPIPSCGKENFQYWVLAPVLPGINAVVFGELNKVVAVSVQRFSNMSIHGDTYVLEVNGAQGETITLYTYNIEKKTVQQESCSFTTAGVKEVIIGKGGTITC